MFRTQTKMYMKKITFLFLWIGLNVFGQNFVDATGNLPQLAFGFSAWGDYDGDGDLDLYYTGQLNSNNTGGLYQNNQGNFTLVANSGLPLRSLGAAVWGDLDNDQDLDIIITGYNGTIAVTGVYLNNGNGTFSLHSTNLPGIEYSDVALADLNGDGILDLGLTGLNLSANVKMAKIYLGSGNGNFNEVSGLTLPPINNGHLKFVDYDNDGDVDFVLNGENTATNSPYTHIWENDGAANFTEKNFSLPQLKEGDVEWGDTNNDGKPDLVITGTATGDSEAHLMINNGTSFDEAPNFNVMGAQNLANIELADFNNDQSLDVYIAGANYANNTATLIAKIYLNGAASFSENTNVNLVPLQYVDAHAVDYDADGKVDLFETGVDANYSGKTKLYHNGAINAVKDNLLTQFRLYPNPASVNLHIVPLTHLPYQVFINDLTGKMVFNGQSDAEMEIRVADYPKGIYLVKIVTAKTSLVQKLIIK